jgi:regulator of sigma E protease
MEFLSFIWSSCSGYIIGLIVLSVLVFVHELGHFLVAKYFNVGVLEFAIGFGKKLWSFKRNETTYSLRAIPLGGYVRMLGDDPFNPPGQNTRSDSSEESKLPELQAVSDELSKLDPALVADRSRWFLEKPLYQRALVVFAGPFFNFAFAFLLAASSQYFYGVDVPVNEPIVGQISVGMPAEKGGLLPGDRVVRINGEKITTWSALTKVIRGSDGSPLRFDVVRKYPEGPKAIVLTVKPQLESQEMALITGAKNRSYVVGIAGQLVRVAIPIQDAIIEGVLDVYGLSITTLKSFGWLIQGALSPKNIGGPITILKESASSAKKGFEQLLWFMFFLSVSLAVLNLLPIPVLDGGHLFFYAIEAIKRGPVSLKFQQMANQCGMFLLLALMLFAIGNDVFNLL